jgi:hypothetical protein
VLYQLSYTRFNFATANIVIHSKIPNPFSWDRKKIQMKKYQFKKDRGASELLAAGFPQITRRKD